MRSVLRNEQEVVALGGSTQMGLEELKEATALHVSPQQFHSLLDQSVEDSTKETVLLDVRNLYETRVGHFDKVCMIQHTFKSVFLWQEDRGQHRLQHRQSHTE